MRKLASIRRISNIKDIPDAEFIQAYQVDGWWVVGKKDQFKINALVCYFEIDSWIPHEIAPFLSKDKEPKIYENIKGQRLRTIKLKGQISQGLILPLNDTLFPNSRIKDLKEDEDVTEELQIKKWERPLSQHLQGKAKGYFSASWRKTDQERIQNLTKEFQYHYVMDTKFEVTIKLDGSSLSVGVVINDSNEPEYTICSRNLSLKTDDEDNVFVKIAKKYFHEIKFHEFDIPIQISGELMGPRIQGNPENLIEHDLYIYDVYDPIEQRYFTPKERMIFLSFHDYAKHVPILHNDVSFKELNIHSIDDLLEFANGKSMNAEKREGLVFKQMDGNFSFKVISNDYLLKNKMEN